MSTKKEINEILTELAKAEKLNNHIQELDAELMDLQDERNKLDKRLSKELADVERIESVSLTSLIHKVAGNKEDKIEKEREEYMEVALQIKENEEAMDLIEYERSVIVGKKTDISKLKPRLELLKKQRLDELIQTNSDVRNKVNSLYNRKDYAVMKEEELQQAKNATFDYQQKLSHIYDHLRNAEYWLNVYASTKRIRAKQNRYQALDRAIYESSNLKLKARVLMKELLDVGINYKPEDISIDYPRKNGISFFIRNIVSELSDLALIGMTKKEIEVTANEVKAIKLKIDQMIAKNKIEMHDVSTQLDELPLKY